MRLIYTDRVRYEQRRRIAMATQADVDFDLFDGNTRIGSFRQQTTWEPDTQAYERALNAPVDDWFERWEENNQRQRARMSERHGKIRGMSKPRSDKRARTTDAWRTQRPFSRAAAPTRTRDQRAADSRWSESYPRTLRDNDGKRPAGNVLEL